MVYGIGRHESNGAHFMIFLPSSCLVREADQSAISQPMHQVKPVVELAGQQKTQRVGLGVLMFGQSQVFSGSVNVKFSVVAPSLLRSVLENLAPTLPSPAT